jgi:hypothetical protein
MVPQERARTFYLIHCTSDQLINNYQTLFYGNVPGTPAIWGEVIRYFVNPASALKP